MAQQVTQSDVASSPTTPVVSLPDRRSARVMALALALLTVVVYLPAMGNGFVSWDDGHYVYENTNLHPFNWQLITWALTDVKIVYWHPITWLSHALDVAVWGLNPLGHHLTNILLHGMNTFFVVIVSAKLLYPVPAANNGTSSAFGGLGRREALIGAGLTGALFGLHPVHVESVAWVAERKDLLYTLFYLLGLLAYADYAHTCAFRADTLGFLRQRSYLLAFACFIFSLASKPMAVTFPVIIMLMDWFPFYRDRKDSKIHLLLEKVPFLVLGGAISAVTVFAQRDVGAMVALSDIPLATRLLVSFQSLVIYIRMLLFPVGLLPLYPYPESVAVTMPVYAGSIVAVTGITIACLLAAKRERLWLAVWASYVVGVLPVIGLLQAGPQPWADRFIYLPSLGFFLLAGIGGACAWSKVPAKKWCRKILAGLALIIVVSLGGMTVAQIFIWQDSMHMWTHVINKVPHKLPIAYHNRGILFTDQGDFDRAIADASEAIALDPEYADAYNNRGNAFIGKKNYAMAATDFSKAIVLKPADAALYNNLGLALAAMARFDEAIEAYDKALSIRPDYVDAFNHRGLAFARMGDIERGLADFDRAADLKPAEAKTHIYRGIVVDGQGRAVLAEKEYSAALELNPDPGVAATAYTNRGVLRFNRKDYEGAMDDFNAAVQLAPKNIAAFNNRGALYRLRGEHRQAVADFSRVLELDPNLVKAYLDRGDAYLQDGNRSLARDDFETACKMGSADGCTRSRSTR